MPAGATNPIEFWKHNQVVPDDVIHKVHGELAGTTLEQVRMANGKALKWTARVTEGCKQVASVRTCDILC